MDNTQEIQVKLRNDGTINKNCVTINGAYGSVKLFFSYETIIAVSDNYGFKCSVNYWGKTTGKYLNELEPNYKDRVEHKEVLAYVDVAIKRAIFGDKEVMLDKLKEKGGLI